MSAGPNLIQNAISAAAPGVIGLLGSLFGGGGAPSNPYASQVSGALNDSSRMAGNLANLGSSAANTYSQFGPQYDQAVQNYARYLQQNPYTSAYSTALLNQAMGNTTTAYQQARSQLESQLAQRGMAGSGLEAGALGGLAASQASTIGNAQYNVGMNEISQLGLNQQALVNLLSEAAGNAYGQATGSYGGAANIYNNVAQQYMTMGNEQEQYNMDYQNQQNQALAGLGSGLSSSLEGYFGGQQQNNQFNQLLGAIKGMGSNGVSAGSSSDPLSYLSDANLDKAIYLIGQGFDPATAAQMARNGFNS